MSRYRDAALFSALALLWGGGFTAIEVGLETLDPLLFAAYRFDLGAAVTLLALAALNRLSLPSDRSGVLGIVAAGTLLVFGNVFFLFFGQVYTSGSVAAVVYSLNPVMTAVFAALLLDTAGLDFRSIVGVGLGLLGVGMVARPNPANPGADAVGALLVFCAVLAVSSGSVLVRRFDGDIDSLSLTGWSMALGAVLLHGASLIAGESVVPPTAVPSLAAIAYLGIGGSALAYGIYFTLLERTGPFAVNLVNYAIPPVAAVVGWWYLDERLSALSLLGFVAILAGFLLVNRHAVRRELAKVRGAPW
ncbi:DMT family transporter [Halorussus amylolyticus]|uniref:DMT family transporter n=1 Tax=Halorussus amylolyticus TaxID=1126242 RepID=UPI00105100F2|nr:DMT family transporter [Halorussus amylolyticus]